MTSPDKQAVSGIAGIPSAAHLTGWRLSAGDEHRVYDAEGNRIVDVACGGMSGRSFAEAADVARLIGAATMLLEGAQDTVVALRLLRIGAAAGTTELDAKALEVIDAHIDELAYAIAAATGGAA